MDDKKNILSQNLINNIYKEYEEKTKKSKELFEQAKRYLPGGNTRTTLYWDPHPIYFKNGKGCTFFDMDENPYLDFLGNYTSLIHGHSHPKILEAIRNAAEMGTSVHVPTEYEIKLAKLMCERFPSVDKIRFTNSGTEATLNAMRLARVYTGKDKIMKAEGAYHGTHLVADVSYNPDLTKVGPIENPISVPNPGTPLSIAKEVIVYPFNNQEITEKIFKKHKGELAAIIVEPLFRTIPPENDYLKFLREITADNDIPLIFDEVICARICKGGAQEFYNVIPDLTAFGKIFGGGLPFGAFGGRDEIMKLSDPSKKGSMSQAGTFNGNPLTMAAGSVATEMLTSDEINRINLLGEIQREGMKKMLEEIGIIAKITGEGSLTTLYFTDEEVKEFRASARSNKILNNPLYILMLINGISIAKRLFTAISTPMTKNEIIKFNDILRMSLEKIKPIIKEIDSKLISS